MSYGPYLEPLAAAIHDACFGRLKRILWKDKSGQIVYRRLRATDCDVTMFSQTWALPHLVAGGPAFTSTPTIVVEGPSGDAAVYFGEQFAYYVERPTELFLDDVRRRCMVAADNPRKDLYDAPRPD